MEQDARAFNGSRSRFELRRSRARSAGALILKRSPRPPSPFSELAREGVFRAGARVKSYKFAEILSTGGDRRSNDGRALLPRRTFRPLTRGPISECSNLLPLNCGINHPVARRARAPARAVGRSRALRSRVR